MTPSKSMVAEQPSLFTRLPQKATRVKVFRNGSDNEHESATIACSSMEELLRVATQKLAMVSAARKVFSSEGKVITELDDLENDTVVYVSGGESFLDPKRRGIRITTAAIGADHRLVRQTTKRLFAKRNGDDSNDRVIVVAPLPGLYTPAQEMEMLLTDCTAKLNLVACAKRVYTDKGKLVGTVAELNNEQTIYVSVGEPWIVPGDKSPVKRGTQISDDHRLLSVPAKAVLALRNGHKSLNNHATLEKQLEYLHSEAVLVVGNSMEKLLEAATTRLRLTSAARRLYTAKGEPILDFEQIERETLYFVSVGEGFIDPMDPTQLAANHIVELPSDSHLSPAPKKRMLAFRNGESSIRDAVRVVASSWRQVMEECTRKLKLVVSARKLYTIKGVPITSLKEISNDMKVVVSSGEPFKPLDGSKPESLITPISEGSRLLSKGNTRLLAYRNGWGARMPGKHIVGSSIKELLSEATRVLGLPAAARKLFNEEGGQIKDMIQLSRDMVIYVSLGEAFVPRKSLLSRRPPPSSNPSGGKSHSKGGGKDPMRSTMRTSVTTPTASSIPTTTTTGTSTK